MNTVNKLIFRLIISFLLIFFVLCGTGLWYLTSSGPLKEKTVVVIKKNSSESLIYNQLIHKKVIKNDVVSYLALRLVSTFYPIKFGQYSFYEKEILYSVIKKIILHDVVLYKITVPEGFTSYQIKELINKAPYLKGKIIRKLPEGAFFPSTYHYFYNQTKEQILTLMHKEMLKKTTQLWLKRNKEIPIKSRTQGVILASIVQRESASYTDQVKIACVFLNRLNHHMKLQSDVTVIYALGKGRNFKTHLYRKRIKFKSPYNTYLIPALPPTPIDNPGMKALKAVFFNPMKCTTLYFKFNKGKFNFF